MPQKLLNKQTQKHSLSLNQSMKKSLDILKMNEKELLEAIRDLWSYVKKTDTDFRESADTANSTKDFLRFLP